MCAQQVPDSTHTSKGSILEIGSGDRGRGNKWTISEDSNGVQKAKVRMKLSRDIKDSKKGARGGTSSAKKLGKPRPHAEYYHTFTN